VECPRENELAGLLRNSPLLNFRPDRTQQLEIIAVRRLRPDQTCESQTQLAFHNGEEMVGAPLGRERECSDELPHVILPLERDQELVVGILEGA